MLLRSIASCSTGRRLEFRCQEAFTLSQVMWVKLNHFHLFPQAQIVMKIVDPKVAIAMLNRSHDQIPPAMPDDKEPPAKIALPTPSPTVPSSIPGTTSGNQSIPPSIMNPNIASVNVHGMPSSSYPPQNAGMMPAGPGGNLPPGPYAVDPHAMNGPPNPNTSMICLFFTVACHLWIVTPFTEFVNAQVVSDNMPDFFDQVNRATNGALFIYISLKSLENV